MSRKDFGSQKKHGVPNGTVSNPSGQGASSDKKPETIKKEAEKKGK